MYDKLKAKYKSAMFAIRYANPISTICRVRDDVIRKVRHSALNCWINHRKSFTYYGAHNLVFCELCKKWRRNA